MKFLNTKTLAALAIASAFSFGNAHAMIKSTMPVYSVNGVSSASLTVTVDNGIATLFGSVDSGIESALAESHVAKLDGVEKVINQIQVK